MSSRERTEPPVGRSSLRETRAPWRNRLLRLVAIDERSLASFRISLALVLLVDLALRARNLTAHYSDAGAIPRSIVDVLSSPSIEIFFLYGLHGSTVWAAFLFVVTAAAATALLLGYRANWAAAVCCYLVFCLHARTPSVTHGGDDLLRLLITWAALLPLGETYGPQAAARALSSPRARTIATAAVKLQLTALLWLAPLAGTRDTSRIFSSTAISDALRLDPLLTSWGSTLAGWPDLVRFADLTTSALLVTAPLLLWSPFFSGPLRSLAVLCLMQFQLLAIAPAFELGIQPWVSVTALTLFLPTWLWDQITESVRGGGRRHPAFWPRRAAVGALALIVFTLGLVGRSAVELGVHRQQGPASRLSRLLGIGVPRSILLPSSTDVSDGWLVARGIALDGNETDTWRMTELSYDRPVDIAASFRGPRWRAHVMQAIAAPEPAARLSLIQYLCRRRDENLLTSRLSRVELVFMLDRDSHADESESALPVALAASRCDNAGTGLGGARPASRTPQRH